MTSIAQQFLNANDYSTADLMDALDEMDLPKMQDWREGNTTWEFEDGSRICVCGPCVEILDADSFCERANSLLKELGIGTYDNGQLWCEYTMDDDGNVYATDYNESIRIDWRTESDDDIREFASAYQGDE